MKKLITLLFASVLLNSPVLGQEKINKVDPDNFHKFDFWIGKWDVYYFGTEKMAGKSDIAAINQNTAIIEDYKASDINYVGKFISKYNPAKDRLEQYWTDNSGRTLYLTGAVVNDKIILDDANGNEKHVNRVTIEKMQNGSIRLTWTESIDLGKTWKTVFDGEYRKT